jgi:hypothetical protein
MFKRVLPFILMISMFGWLFASNVIDDNILNKEKQDVKSIQIAKMKNPVLGLNKALGDTIFMDDFNAGLDTTAWTVIDGSGDGETWTDTNPGGRSNAIWDSTFIIVDSDWAGSIDMDEQLLSPFVDCSAFSNVSLDFNHYFNQYSASVGTVDVRVGANGTWTNVATYTADVTEVASIDISTVAGNSDSVQVRFGYTGNWEWYWGIDNFIISGSNTDEVAPSVTITAGGLNHTVGFGDVNVVATITDASGIASASVMYSVNDINGTYSAVAMAATGNADEYAAAIPAAAAGDSVFYYVEATDASSNANVGYAPAPGFVYLYAVFANYAAADDSGYTWKNSYNEDGDAPVYAWIDTAGATLAAIAGDDVRGTVDLPFPINFYGNVYTQITVTTNGWIGMGPLTNYSSSYYVNQSLLNTAIPNNVVAPMWDDFRVGSTYHGGIYLKTVGDYPNRQFVVTWQDVPRLTGATDYFSFQAIIEEGSNNITYQYADVTAGTTSDYGLSATVGIENGDGTVGHQYTFNTAGPIVMAGDAVKFYSPFVTPLVDWCNLQWPYTITIDQGSNTGAVYGQIYEAGITDPAGAGAGIGAQFGYGPAGSDPRTSVDWVWADASFNLNVGNNDEYMADVQVTASGEFSYCFRYNLDGGPWTYGDMDGSSNGFSLDQMGAMTVNALSGTQKVLISEIVVTPTGGEFVEIYNADVATVVLNDYYLSDATYASGNTYYYQIVEGAGGGGTAADWTARFPDGATIEPGEYQTVALAGDSLFFVEYGVMPTYELYEDGHAAPADAPDMRESFTGSINNQGGLTNSDEMVVIFYWDGASDLVKDSDYLIYNSGSPVANNEAVDKTGVLIDGPDADSDSSAYLPDTPIASQMSATNHDFGFSLHRIDYTEGAQVSSGGNGITGADETSEDLNNTFSKYSIPSPGTDRVMPTYTVSGTVTATDGGAALAGVDVSLGAWSAVTDTAGAYSIAGVDSGTYAISFALQGYLTYSATLSVQANITFDIALDTDPALLRQDFEGGSLPAGWLTSSNGVGWLIGDNLGSSYFSIPPHTVYAASNDDASNDDASVDYLISPALDLSGVNAAQVSFQSFYNGAYGQIATVEVSEDGGASWAVVATLAPSVDWEQVDVDLSAYCGAGHTAVHIGFHANDAGSWASGWAVDDVVVTELELGSISGTVTAATGGVAVEFASVMVGSQTATTDASGAYSFDGVVVGVYDLDVEAAGYNSAMVSGVVVETGGNTVVDVALTAPTMEVNVASVDTSVAVGDTILVPVTITNNGDGPLEYRAVANLNIVKVNHIANLGREVTEPSRPMLKSILQGNAGERSPFEGSTNVAASKAPWDLQFAHDLLTITGAQGNAGAEFDGTYFYTTRWASNLIHQYNADGTLAGEHSVLGVTGLRDLAWDGQYLYGGAAANTIYCIDPTNWTLVTSFSSSVAVRTIAYDSMNDAFWVSNWDTDIALVDRSGNTLATIPAATHGFGGMYGSAYDDVSEGGPFLWVFDQNGVSSAGIVHQIDLMTGAPTGVSFDIVSAVSSDPTDLAGGLFITADYQAGTATIGGVVQGNAADQLVGFELTATNAWMSLNGNSGVVEAGASATMNLVLSGTVMAKDDVVYNGSVVCTSTPDVGVAEIPVTLTITGVVNGIGDMAVPMTFDMAQNYPNPFNPTTTVNFQLPKKSDVRITVYNALGQVVRTLASQSYDAGRHQVVWDGTNNNGAQVSTGIYIYRMEAGDFVKSMKMILMK